MLEQRIITSDKNYKELNDYLHENQVRRIFLVCGSSITFLRIGKYFDSLEMNTGIKVIYFTNFKPNPCLESVIEGISLFHQENCDMIIAVGGGSAMDVAKCVKLYSNMDHNISYFKQVVMPNDIKLLAVPTTAGSGSEATQYAVIYFNGEKQSISDYSIIPSAVLMDPTVLETLPLYQKKSTMMDAFCHALESFWSVNSTEQSKDYSKEAIRLILENKNSYFKNHDAGNANMLYAANIAGKAINITQTTAGHAMSYKLTSLYGIAHGHAVALCVARLWPYMLEHMDKSVDPRGTNYLCTVFSEIAEAMGSTSPEDAVQIYQKILDNMEFVNPTIISEKEYELLRTSVNPVRLKNNPVELDIEVIDSLFHQILGGY
jgi:alcohol dehydrogenase class IV